MASKHRLIFLGTLLVGLLLFYFGVNTWMEQKSRENTPPPPIVIKQPKEKQQSKIEMKKEEIQKVETPSLQPKEQKKEQKAEKKVEHKKSPQEPSQKPKQSVKKEQKKKKILYMAKISKKKKIRRRIKIYVFQIGAFRNKENALKALRIAKRKGFIANIVRTGKIYKVYVYAKSPSYIYAYKKVKKHFKDAFPVRR